MNLNSDGDSLVFMCSAIVGLALLGLLTKTMARAFIQLHTSIC